MQLYPTSNAVHVAAAGMANQHRYPHAAPLHFSLAILSLLINLWATRVEYRNVSINVGIIDEVMNEVERIRAERGLPPSAEAWDQSS